MVALTPKLPGTLLAMIRHFSNPETCSAYVSEIKWPSGACCPKCGSVNVGEIKSRARFQCREKGCRKQFSLITDTIFEGTHLRLDQWFAGVWMIVNCKNGVSSCEIARAIGCKQQSAWHLLHRVRHCLQQNHVGKIGENRGAVECDSTFVGGIFKFMSFERQERARKSGRPHNKCVVHAIKDRKSSTVRANVTNSVSTDATKHEVQRHVERGANIYTDQGREYRWLTFGSGYRHDTVNHSILEYARGPVSTNGCENFFNCLRRGLKGTYIWTTPEHLGAYVDEAVFRFNHRTESDWERFDRAMRLIVGKRLTYETLTDGATR